MRKTANLQPYLMRLITQSGKFGIRVLLILGPVIFGALLNMVKHSFCNAETMKRPVQAPGWDDNFENDPTHPDYWLYIKDR
jgi:hypothetical protein